MAYARMQSPQCSIFITLDRKGIGYPIKIHGWENLEAITFLCELNQILHEQHPGVLIVAEESTAWPMISRLTYLGGLGFSMKWNMGWMNDTLAYMDKDPIYRYYHHDVLTFGLLRFRRKLRPPFIS